jgi:outer membrane protein assembly factor BamB
MGPRRRSASEVREVCAACALSILAALAPAAAAGADAETALGRLGLKRGIAAVLGLPEGAGADFVVALAEKSELSIFFQSPDAAAVEGVRELADRAGLLGARVFAAEGGWSRVHLADNVAGALLASAEAAKALSEAEALRVVRPEGRAILGERERVKPRPEGVDSWSHPFHGPDNNPQSTDRLARAPYLTQFLAEPMFCPMPEVSVAAGGRVFRAFGHIAHKANQNALLNTLLAIDGFNGAILWRRPLREGFMIHRNSMVATPETLYLADDVSLKRLDARSGDLRGEIVVPEGIADGPVWKWLALEGGTLYALVGGREVPIPTQPSRNTGLGHWPWGMWPGHDYADPKTSFGSGRTFAAFDAESGKLIWSHREDEYIDTRGVCMKGGRIYFYSPEKFLACLDTKSGEVRWRSSEPALLEAIGPNGKAQHYITGYATTAYIKCTDKQILFAGPQRRKLVAVDARDGYLLWQKPQGNLQLVLRDDGIYAAGPEQTGCKLDYESGAELARLSTRRACTRATGSIDSIFYRAAEGTVRLDLSSGETRHIAPMRPPCQDGVIISDGHLYWGPWMCGCSLSLYGHICLGPAGDFDFKAPADASRLETGGASGAGGATPAAFALRAGDWPAYRGDNRRSDSSAAPAPRTARQRWVWTPPTPRMATAPIAAGGLVFIGDRAGAIRAIDAATGQERWKAYAGGALFLPPAIEDGRLFAGAADGRVVALEAASGRRLWSFRVAPIERRIPVYGVLISTWPAAGGVAVEDGVVYAAAGIAHYDGTHVAALDAATGTPRWYNHSSGTLSEKVLSGISLQGELSIAGGELRFPGGNVYPVARYDLKTGACLNAASVHEQPTSRVPTAHYAYYPDYAQYLSLRRDLADGRTLSFEASYEGSRLSELALLAPARAGAKDEPAKDDRPSKEARRAPPRQALWKRSGFAYNAFVISPAVLIAVQQSIAEGALTAKGAVPGGRDPAIAALAIDDGAEIWRLPLPAPAVRGGAAVDADGRIYVSLVDGRVLCFDGDGT